MTPAGELDDHPRVLALIEQFRRIDAGMRDLPIYNDKIAIAAIGFRVFGEAELLGVVLTPWFMNLIMLPIERVPLDMHEIGKTVSVELPAGQRNFVIGGDKVIGLYKAHSLHSPVLNFTLPGQAQAEAKRMLALLMTPANTEAEPKSDAGTSGVDRRSLLFGRRSG